MTQTRIVQRMMMIGVVFACIAGAYAAWIGYSTATSNVLLAAMSSVVPSFLVLVTCESLVLLLPRLDIKGRVISASFAALLMVLTFNFSTLWGVMALGGKTAINAHVQKTVLAADKAALDAYQQCNTEKNMAPQLRAMGTNFRGLAAREDSREFSGLAGKGEVYSSLLTTSNLFDTSATTIDQVGTQCDDDYEKYQKLSNTARKLASEIMGTDVTEGAKLRELFAKFGDNLQQMNSSLVEVRSRSARGFVKSVSTNLAQLAMTPQASTNQAQKAALDRLMPSVKSAQKMVDQIIGDDKVGEKTDQTFTMMAADEAIWEYAGRIKTAWGTALAIDMVPFFLAFLQLAFLKTAREDDEEEKREREAEKAAGTIHRVDRTGTGRSS